jgi:dTDP-4-amino-4,6-dideoxygalactose transaminase
MIIPFLDLFAQNGPLKGEIDAAIQDVINTSAFAGGEAVTRFEKDFAAYCNCRYAVGVGSGTEALWLALLALGVGPGDEVITVPNSFMATAEAISYCGARPVFVDVDECTYLINPAQWEKAITAKTKAIIPVHLFGQLAPMEPILEVARRHGLLVIEDACQAHGAQHKGQRAGSLSAAACFSFYPGKNLGAFGEAGAVVTNNSHLQEKIRILRDHGQVRKYRHSMVGWNCRMDGIQAAVLRVKLKYLDRGNESRRAHAAHYDRALGALGQVITPFRDSDAAHVFHVYAIRVKQRDKVMRSLSEKGVGCAVHYPCCIHLQEAYRSLGYPEGSFPVAEKCAAEFISLPMFPELTPTQVDMVVESLKEAMAS